MLQIVEIETMMKTRRSLLVTSIATLTFANIKLLSNKATVFGLEIEISQLDLVKIGQVATAYLIIIFIAQATPSFFKAVGWFRETRINKAERSEWRKFREDWGLDQEDYGDYDNSGGPEDESKQLKAEYDWRRKKLDDWTTNMSSGSFILANVFFVYFMPLAIGFVEIFYPLSFKFLIS
jgi:hypothetical protein